MIWGAIIGDYVGSAYEFSPVRGRDLPLITPRSRPTDETILIAATCEALRQDKDYRASYLAWGNRYPDVGFGPRFLDWLRTEDEFLTDSWGNSAATRAIPIAYSARSLEQALSDAMTSACVSHCSEHGIRSTQAVVETLYRLRAGEPSSAVYDIIHSSYYPLDIDLEQRYREGNQSSAAIDTVPVALKIGLEANSLTAALRMGLYIGGDVDSILTVAGAVVAQRLGIDDPDLLARAQQKLSCNYPDAFEILSATATKTAQTIPQG